MYLKETSELAAAGMAPHGFRPPFFPGMMGLVDGVTVSAVDPMPVTNGVNGVVLQPTPKVNMIKISST